MLVTVTLNEHHVKYLLDLLQIDDGEHIEEEHFYSLQAALLAAAQLAGEPTKSAGFLFDGEEYSLSAMLLANDDDTDVCNWLRTANIGDVYPGTLNCKRLY